MFIGDCALFCLITIALHYKYVVFCIFDVYVYLNVSPNACV